MEIHQATQHRWQYILPRIGIEPRYLRNTHQPCPICGGKDRFRFDDKDGMRIFWANGSLHFQVRTHRKPNRKSSLHPTESGK